VMYRWFNIYHNNNRFTCPKMPPEVKTEYINKCKEYSFFRADKFRRQREELKQIIQANEQMLETVFLLPPNLMVEVCDLEQQYDTDDTYNEESQFNDFIEYKPLFLYGQQILRVYPDDLHQLFRTHINSPALLKTQLLVGDSDSKQEAAS
jgi:hypothetical protein